MEKVNYENLTKEQLVRALIKLQLKVTHLEKQLNAINNFLKIESSVFQIKRK